MAGSATSREMDLAVEIAQAVIKRVEGGRGVVLAEVFSILGAFYMAQRRLQGREPVGELHQLLAGVLEQSQNYDNIGLLQLGH